MAHQVETMAYAGEVPWHGLGVPVSDDLTPQQIQTKAGLDWSVEKRDIFTKTNNGIEVRIPGKKALTRDIDDKIFDVAILSPLPAKHLTYGFQTICRVLFHVRFSRTESTLFSLLAFISKTS